MAMFCSHCGASIQADPQFLFCGKCGKSVTPSSAPLRHAAESSDRNVTVVLKNESKTPIFSFFGICCGILGIFTLGFVFVPLGLLFTFIGLLCGEFLVGTISGVINIIGFFTSPVLMALIGLGAILGGANVPKNLASESMKKEIQREVVVQQPPELKREASAISVYEEILPKQLLSKVYGKYNQKFDCWHNVVTNQNEEQNYCMKLGRIDKVQVDTVIRYYVLALGNIVDDEGKPSGSHASTGMVGAFIMELKNGEPVTVASNAALQMGSFGNAPTSWKFVKLGSADYWGWQSASGDCNFGDCYENHILLAPYGKNIRDLTGGAIGTASTDSDKNAASISVKLAIDSSQSKAQVFPLLLTVTGELDDQKMPAKNFTVPFDTKAWKYTMPKEWIPKDRQAWGN